MNTAPHRPDGGSPDQDPEASARVIDAVMAARNGEPGTPGTITAVVADYVAGRIPHHQMSAWLATTACMGLDLDGIEELTRAYMAGGTAPNLRRPGRPLVDKHSTGGVGDNVSLVVVPVVAACGVAVAKMSGRGLGHAGGTIDKLESIPGLRLDLSAAEMRDMLDMVGMVISGQSHDLSPGDRATYALRDVTGTVDSLPLIAASIMSKKLATRADALLLDVKVGPGGLSPDSESARELAAVMVRLAQRFDLPAAAVLTDMSQPLGRAVGNALEVAEALAVLRGEYVPGLSELCREVARRMLCAANPSLPGTVAGERVDAALMSGGAHERFVAWAGSQGADTRVLHDPALLPSAPHREVVIAERAGWVTDVDPRRVGSAATRVGAGRFLLNAPLDPSAGVELCRRVGDRVEAGAPLAVLHHAGGAAVETAMALLSRAFSIGTAPPPPRPVLLRVLEQEPHPELHDVRTGA